MNTITRLICTECGTGNFRHHPRSSDSTLMGFAVCDNDCGTFSVALDIAPYADDATLDMDADGYLVAVTA